MLKRDNTRDVPRHHQKVSAKRPLRRCKNCGNLPNFALRLPGHHMRAILRDMIHVLVRVLVLATSLGIATAAETLFQDDFKGVLAPGWSWVREHRDAWRTGTNGLEVLVQPGNMWGGQNNARNVLVRAVPSTNGTLEFLVTVSNTPGHQYEQVNLVWYYNDSNMVKLGQELVDGKLSVVMGREENDKTRTIAIVPLSWTTLDLRAVVKDGSIRGYFRKDSFCPWLEVGECTLPSPSGVEPKISLQCYQGAPGVEHWARITGFRVLRH